MRSARLDRETTLTVLDELPAPCGEFTHLARVRSVSFGDHVSVSAKLVRVEGDLVTGIFPEPNNEWLDEGEEDIFAMPIKLTDDW